MKKPRPAEDPESSKAAYLLGLKWLGARELSSHQVRDRLALRGYTRQAIDDAVSQLLEVRALDDRRTAIAVARTEANIRKRGPRRIHGRLMTLGIDRDLANDIVRELFGDEDETALMERALDGRLRGHADRLQDPDERRKLLGYLVRQGFAISAASALIRKKSRAQ